MKATFSNSELFAIEELTKNVENNQLAKELNIKVRKSLGLSVPLSEDKSIKNVTKNIVREVMSSNKRDEVVLSKKWLNFLAHKVKKFLRGNGFTADETLIRLLGSGNAKEFYAKYPTAKYYEELYAAIQTWLTQPVPPTRMSVVDLLFSIVVGALQFIDGRFGKIVLKPKFRLWWRIVTYSVIAILLWKFIVCPLFETWGRMVNCVNYVARGI